MLAEGQAASPTIDRMRILFVDDEPDITTVIKIGLKGHDFDVAAFNDPKKALSHFRENHSYDIILLDIRMPGMSGFELAKKIWEISDGVRICFMTAFEIYQPEAQKMLPGSKKYCFIKKPITISELVIHIQSHFLT